MVNVTEDGVGGKVSATWMEPPEFPTTIKVEETGNWKAHIMNVGDLAGNIFIGIENKAGNPGNIVVDHGGTGPTVVQPGYVMRYYAVVAPGGQLLGTNGISGTILFEDTGSYFIGLHAGHGDIGNWTTDDYLEVDG